jgi:hypothetical protein
MSISAINPVSSSYVAQTGAVSGVLPKKAAAPRAGRALGSTPVLARGDGPTVGRAVERRCRRSSSLRSGSQVVRQCRIGHGRREGPGRQRGRVLGRRTLHRSRRLSGIRPRNRPQSRSSRTGPLLFGAAVLLLRRRSRSPRCGVSAEPASGGRRGLAEDVAQGLGLARAPGHDQHRRRLQQPRVDRHARQVRPDVRRCGDAHRPGHAVQGRRFGEDRQDVAVVADADEDQVEARASCRRSSAVGGHLLGVAGGAPAVSWSSARARSVGKGWMLADGSGAPPVDPSPPSRTSSSEVTHDSGWPRGTKRSSPHQMWTCGHGMLSTSGAWASSR